MYNEEIDRNLDETGVKEECGVFGKIGRAHV